jgi:hypothetical protein
LGKAAGFSYGTMFEVFAHTDAKSYTMFEEFKPHLLDGDYSYGFSGRAAAQGPPPCRRDGRPAERAGILQLHRDEAPRLPTVDRGAGHADPGATSDAIVVTDLAAVSRR